MEKVTAVSRWTQTIMWVFKIRDIFPGCDQRKIQIQKRGQRESGLLPLKMVGQSFGLRNIGNFWKLEYRITGAWIFTLDSLNKNETFRKIYFRKSAPKIAILNLSSFWATKLVATCYGNNKKLVHGKLSFKILFKLCARLFEIEHILENQEKVWMTTLKTPSWIKM